MSMWQDTGKVTEPDNRILVQLGSGIMPIKNLLVWAENGNWKSDSKL